MAHLRLRLGHLHHLVAVHQALDERLHLGVELHEDDIGGVGQQQRHALPAADVVIQEEDDEHDQVQNVERDVTEKWPPGEVEDLVREDGAHADHEQDVEHGRAHDSADAHVAVWDEHADDGGEELGGGASGRHEGGACYVVWYDQLLGDDRESGHEELITHDGQGDEHVQHAERV